MFVICLFAFASRCVLIICSHHTPWSWWLQMQQKAEGSIGVRRCSGLRLARSRAGRFLTPTLLRVWRRQKLFHSVKIKSERGYVELAPWCVGQVMQNGKQAHTLWPFTYKTSQRFPHADFTWWGWFQSYSYSFVCPGESCTKVKLLLTSS